MTFSFYDHVNQTATVTLIVLQRSHRHWLRQLDNGYNSSEIHLSSGLHWQPVKHSE